MFISFKFIYIVTNMIIQMIKTFLGFSTYKYLFSGN